MVKFFGKRLGAGQRRGDTLVEVMFSVGIFGMVAIGAVGIMNRGLYTAQGALESTMARSEIDTQAEALRFLHDAYIAEDSVAQKTYATLWEKILENAYTPESLLRERPDFYSAYEATAAGEMSCEELYQSLPSRSFVVNPRYLDENTLKASLSKDNVGEVISKLLTTTATSPRLLYTSDEERTELSDAASVQSLDRDIYSVEGIYVTAVSSEAGTGTKINFSPDFFDFYIRTCWDSPGGDGSRTLATTIRLSNSDQISISDDDDPDPTPPPVVPEMQSFNCASLGVGASTILKDARDGQQYTIAKLADGKCWTRVNFRYNPASHAGNIYTSENVDTGETDVYYDWYAATEGGSGDICPTHWRLPTGGEGGDFSVLDKAFGGNGKGLSSLTTAVWLSAPNDFTYSGRYVGGSVEGRYASGYGYFWSSTALDGDDAYYAYLHNREVDPTASSEGGKDQGFAVRCLAEDEYYQVAFEPNGATRGSMMSQTVQMRTSFDLPYNAFSRDNYDFTGWNTVANPSSADPGQAFSDHQTILDPVGKNQTLRLYAQWKRKSYTISFRGNGETSGSMSDVSEPPYVAENYQLPANAFRKNYFHFNQWTGSDRLNYADRGIVNKPESFAGQTLVLTAQWLCDQYVIILWKNDGTSINSAMNPCRADYVTLMPFSSLLDFPRSGYRFMGWAESSSGSVAYNDGATVRDLAGARDGVKNLYAVWKELKTHTLAYNMNGGTGGPSDESYGPTTDTSHSFTVSATQPSRSGYQFSGWNTKSDGTGTSYAAGSSVTVSGTTTLYAQWGSVQTYRLTYDMNGGTGGPSDESYGPTTDTSHRFTVSSTKPTLAGYTFVGWGENKTEAKYIGGDFVTLNTSNPSKTLYAVWVVYDWCVANGKTSMQGWTGAGSLAIGGETTLCDARDGNSYKVGKLADGKVWMLQDLRLDTTSLKVPMLNSANTDHPGTLTGIKKRTTYVNYTYLSSDDWEKNYAGATYDYTTRTYKISFNGILEFLIYDAGGVKSGIYSATMAMANTNGTGSICPSGWHLPKNSPNEFCSLAQTSAPGFLYDCQMRYVNYDGDYRGAQDLYKKFLMTASVYRSEDYWDTTYHYDSYYEYEEDYWAWVDGGMVGPRPEYSTSVQKLRLYLVRAVCYNNLTISAPGATSSCDRNGNWGHPTFWQNDGTTFYFAEGYLIPEGGGTGTPGYYITAPNGFSGTEGSPIRCVKD